MIAKRFSISKENLERFYWHDCLSIKDIARRLNCSHRTIHVRMVECGIPRRKSGVPGPNITYSELKRFYLDQGLSSRKISKIYECAYSTIDRKIRSCGFPVKTLAASHIASKRESFNGTPKDKAYLIGFRIGDLRVRKMYKRSETIMIDCGSTHNAQITLINSLFSPYGKIWISNRNRSGKTQIQCHVNQSFDFLLKKFNKFPDWTLKRRSYFLSILAGFVDAEGSFFISGGKAFFSLGNYAFALLRQIQKWMGSNNINARLYLSKKKGTISKDGYVSNGDYWNLSVQRKQDLYRFTKLIKPYLRHGEKIAAAVKVVSNIDDRNKMYGFINMDSC